MSIGPRGLATSNAQYGAPLREAYRNLAATRGAVVVDLTQVTGQILANYVTSPDASDPRVRDRIHETPFVYRLEGDVIGRAIAGDIIRKSTASIDAVQLPIRYFANSWSSSLRTPYVTVDENRVVQVEGILEAGTKADGTAIISFPTNLRPARVRTFWTTSVRNSDGRQTRVKLELVTSGNVLIYGMPSDDNYIFLDAIRFQAP
ncbi:hypothetical protein [Ensifer sesbaniae]|uniref:hypothetical protein n=1 Tax=Ensifer sesbaniae TaxID=1214071 RepID=UPI001569964A|nr:hypothetical protein [Ensifer sesbaniae]NRQ14608.1 hypothetical protein [Ensifer sesbaniae]